MDDLKVEQSLEKHIFVIGESRIHLHPDVEVIEIVRNLNILNNKYRDPIYVGDEYPIKQMYDIFDILKELQLEYDEMIKRYDVKLRGVMPKESNIEESPCIFRHLAMRSILAAI